MKCSTCAHGNRTGDKACETCIGSNYEEDEFRVSYYNKLEGKNETEYSSDRTK